MPKRLTTVINGQKWTVQFSPKMQDYGVCEVTQKETGKVSRQIKVRDGQTDVQLLDTLIHEALHAYYWDILGEHAVTRSAKDITALLTKVFSISRK